MNRSIIPLTFTVLFTMLFLLGAAGAIASEGGASFALSLALGAVGAPLSALVSVFRAPLEA